MSAEMTGSRRAQWRRLVAGLTPVVACAAAPWLLLAAYGQRLPDRALVGGWVGIGSEYRQFAPTWTQWAAGYLVLSALAAVFVGGYLWQYRWWPSVQRLLATVAWAVLLYAIAGAVLDVAVLLDASSLPSSGVPLWGGAVNVAAIPVGAALGWLLHGPSERRPFTTEMPSLKEPVLALGDSEQAVFIASLWSRRQLGIGAALIVLALAAALVKGLDDRSHLLFLAFGVAALLIAKARVHVGHSGFELRFPLLGNSSIVFDYGEIRFAEVRPADTVPPTWGGLIASGNVWGFFAAPGEVLAVYLSDGSEFIVTVQGAEDAAALINGELARLPSRRK